jgi:HNH endonuclease
MAGSNSTWWTPERRRAQSERTRAAWKNPGRRENFRAYLAKCWQDPDYRRAQSELAHRRWQEPDYRHARQETVQDPEYRRAQSELARRRWQDPEYRRRQIEARLDVARGPRPEHSAFMRALWKTLSPEARAQQVAAMRAVKVSGAAGGRRWKGGRFLRNGYVSVNIGPGLYRSEHRLIAERALGRPLNRNECVHHWNEDRTDNSARNLLICTRGYHQWLHAKIKQRASPTAPPPHKGKSRRARAKQ